MPSTGERAARTNRCPAAHPEDRRPCEGPGNAIRIVDARSEEVTGCVRHAAVLLSSLHAARVYPGSVDGAAIEVYRRAQWRRPFDFVTDDAELARIHERRKGGDSRA